MTTAWIRALWRVRNDEPGYRTMLREQVTKARKERTA